MSQIPPLGAEGPPGVPAAERMRITFQRREETDYIFSYWTALGWTILTFGIFGIYVFYQLMRRVRDHNRRRLELLDAATIVAWEEAGRRGLQDELKSNFERVAAHIGTMRQMTTDFREPAVWVVLAVFSGIGYFVAFVLLDQDLVKHDSAEMGAQAELAVIYDRLGAPLPASPLARVKGKHNYAGRIVATIFTIGIYLLWWFYNLMNEPNHHFEENWSWENSLASAVQAF